MSKSQVTKTLSARTIGPTSLAACRNLHDFTRPTNLLSLVHFKLYDILFVAITSDGERSASGGELARNIPIFLISFYENIDYVSFHRPVYIMLNFV